MNKKILSFTLFASFLLMFSCADEELSPIITFDKAGKGAYVKLLDETARELDLANLDAAKYSYTVEFVDIDMGSTVETYEINVEFVDNNPGNGEDGAGPITLRTLSSSEFKSSERNFAAVTVDITLNDLLSAFGIGADKIKANDQFKFTTFINTSDGGKFGAANSSSAVNGSAFGGHFNFTLKGTCPLPDDAFAGSYALTYEGDAEGGFGLPFEEGVYEVSPNKPSTTRRQFTVPYLPAFGGFDVGPLGFDVVCEFLVWEFVDSGVGCGAGGITIDAGAVTPISSLSDDAEIKLNIVEYKADGGCGVSPIEKTIVLTKQ